MAKPRDKSGRVAGHWMDDLAKGSAAERNRFGYHPGEQTEIMAAFFAGETAKKSAEALTIRILVTTTVSGHKGRLPVPPKVLATSQHTS